MMLDKQKYIIKNNDVVFVNIPYAELANYVKDDKEAIITSLIRFINDNNISFPYKRHFMKNPTYYFNNIAKLDLSLDSKFFKFNNIIPKMGFSLFEKVFDYRFMGKYRYIRDNYDTYQNINILTDYFTEQPRIESIGHGETKSPMQLWQTDKKLLLNKLIEKKQDIDSYNVREIIYDSVVEARMGKIAQYVTLFNFFKAKRILDPSCAWGDRLIAAIAYKCIYYFGVDPNKDLETGHNEIINTFAKSDKDRYQIVYKPFEFIPISKIESKFDFVLSSPAPFEGDFYGNRDGQSTDNYKEFNQWFLSYMLPTCIMSYQALENMGHFAVTLLDRLRPKPYAIVELLLLCILYCCPEFHYKGVIGWEASKGKVVPFWIFQRNKLKYDKYRKEFAKTALENYYFDIFCEIKDKY